MEETFSITCYRECAQAQAQEKHNSKNGALFSVSFLVGYTTPYCPRAICAIFAIF